MPTPQCPLCYTKLIEKKVTPCMECGGIKTELDHYEKHNYREYEAYFGQRIILCNFCDVDFSSFDPTYFGFKKNKKISFTDFSFVKDINDKQLRIDMFCPNCNYRLPFLNFIHKCRMENKNGTQHGV